MKIIPVGRFEKTIGKLIDPESYSVFLDELAATPEKGYDISGTGGVRGIRWAREGHGKSKGIRVIYYYWKEKEIIYLFLVYPKSEKESLTAKEKSEFKKFVTGLRNEAE